MYNLGSLHQLIVLGIGNGDIHIVHIPTYCHSQGKLSQSGSEGCSLPATATKYRIEGIQHSPLGSSKPSRVQLVPHQAPGSDAESGPNRSPNRIRTRERRTEPNPAAGARKPNRIRFLDAETEPNPVFGPAKRTEFELRIWKNPRRIRIRTPPTRSRVICRHILVLTAITIVSHLRALSLTVAFLCSQHTYRYTQHMCYLFHTALYRR